MGILGARTLTVLHGRLDSLVIGWLLGPLALGYYSVALRMYQVVTEMFTSVIDSVAVPVLANAKHEAEELGRNYLRLVKGSSLLSMTAYAGLVALGPLLVQVAFGPNWSSAGAILRWLGLAGFIVGPLWFNGGVLLATGRAFTWMLVIGTYCILGAVLFPLAALYVGVTGVAMAVVVRGLLLAPLSAGCALRVAQVPLVRYLKAWTPNAAIAIAVAIGAWLGASGAGVADLPLYVTLAAGAGFGLLCFLIVVPRLANGMWTKLLELGGLQR
jgi:PST family polysaccharide transporter